MNRIYRIQAGGIILTLLQSCLKSRFPDFGATRPFRLRFKIGLQVEMIPPSVVLARPFDNSPQPFVKMMAPFVVLAAPFVKFPVRQVELIYPFTPDP